MFDIPVLHFAVVFGTITYQKIECFLNSLYQETAKAFHLLSTLSHLVGK